MVQIFLFPFLIFKLYVCTIRHDYNKMYHQLYTKYGFTKFICLTEAISPVVTE